MSVNTTTQTKPTVRRVTGYRLGIMTALAILSVIVALFASFGLHEWAETSTLHHGIQHALLFTGGLAAGVALTTVFKQNKER